MRRFFGSPVTAASGGIFQHQTQAFCRVQLLIRAYYAFVAFLAILLVPEWPAILGRIYPEPLWPVMWLQWVDKRLGIQLILLLFTGGSLLAAVFPQFRLTRTLVFLGVLEFWAFNNSFGKVGHSLHLIVLTSFLLIFLPRGWEEGDQKSRLIRQMTLLVFWGLQGTVMMAYTMAGLIKIIVGLAQFLVGEPNLFRPDALARHIADRLLQTNSSSPYGGWLIEHTWISWFLMLGTVYLELFALLAVFRPRIQLFFVVGLVLFHISSYFTMTIIFPQNCFLLFLFFSAMPLLRGDWTWPGFFRDLPILGEGWKCLSAIAKRGGG